MAGLQQLLPINACSSVFVRADESNVTCWRALITGPEDTPYSAGCFIFDLYFPPNYPAVPPQVHFKTTGGGKIRFNPNLYDNGEQNSALGCIHSLSPGNCTHPLPLASEARLM